MTFEMNRRQMLSTTAAASAMTAMPLSLITSTAAHARPQAQDNLCLSAHDWLSRRLHSALSRTDVDETWRNNALKGNSCPHCGVHIRAGEQGLLAH